MANLSYVIKMTFLSTFLLIFCYKFYIWFYWNIEQDLCSIDHNHWLAGSGICFAVCFSHKDHCRFRRWGPLQWGLGRNVPHRLWLLYHRHTVCAAIRHNHCMLHNNHSKAAKKTKWEKRTCCAVHSKTGRWIKGNYQRTNTKKQAALAQLVACKYGSLSVTM